MITKPPYVTSRLTQIPPLYHLFLFFEVEEEKQRYAPTHDTFTHVFKELNQIVRLKKKKKKIELESLFSMNHLIQTWSQVQNDRKYKMIAKMLWPLMQVNLPLMFYKIRISSQKYKKRLFDFFYSDVTAFHEVPHTHPCFRPQHHEKRWDPPTPHTWCNYWTAPNFNFWLF